MHHKLSSIIITLSLATSIASYVKIHLSVRQRGIVTGPKCIYKLSSIIITLSLATFIASYVKIHLSIRHQQARIQNHVPQAESSTGASPFHIIRYKKTVSSILWVQLALVVCYVPYVIAAGTGEDNGLAWLAVTTLVFLNSSLNPILYCWRITEVRKAVKDTIRQRHCC